MTTKNIIQMYGKSHSGKSMLAVDYALWLTWGDNDYSPLWTMLDGRARRVGYWSSSDQENAVTHYLESALTFMRDDFKQHPEELKKWEYQYEEDSQIYHETTLDDIVDGKWDGELDDFSEALKIIVEESKTDVIIIDDASILLEGYGPTALRRFYKELRKYSNVTWVLVNHLTTDEEIEQHRRFVDVQMEVKDKTIHFHKDKFTGEEQNLYTPKFKIESMKDNWNIVRPVLDI